MENELGRVPVALETELGEKSRNKGGSRGVKCSNFLLCAEEDRSLV